jgi:hypothetical protein
MSLQQQGNQEGAASFVQPGHSSEQPQAVFNPRMHSAMTFKQRKPFIQHNILSTQSFAGVPLGIEQLQSSLPGGTTVSNYSMHMQPTQNVCTDNHSPFPLQTYVPILSNDANNDAKTEHRIEIPDNHAMSASSINVSTSSYAAPKPHGPSLTQSIQKQGNFAAVPTRKLASKSIILLEPVHFSSVKPTHAPTAMPSIIDLEQSGDKSHESALSVPDVDCLTGEQVKHRERSSYSSACEATLRAQIQRRLSNNGKDNAGNVHANIVSGTVESIPSVTAACSSLGNITEVISLRKRTLPEQPKGRPGHKYVKVVGGKVSPLTKSDPDVSILFVHFFKP